MDMVATSVSGCKGKSCDGKSCGNVKCRKCAENEAWISFKDIKGNLKNNLYKDYSSALEKVEGNTEIKDKLGEYGVCISYSDIMAENNLYKDDPKYLSLYRRNWFSRFFSPKWLFQIKAYISIKIDDLFYRIKLNKVLLNKIREIYN